jgi:indole-3-glycerol phosphate synthase
MSVLQDILAQKARELPALERSRPTDLTLLPTPRNVLQVLRRSAEDPLRLVCEHKRKSPSAGPLSTQLSVEERCVSYAAAGASMISVLCDSVFFDGAYDHLRRARAALDAAGFATPLLAKEFIIDAVQLAHARAHGADAALLIARILPAPRLGQLVDAALALGLTPIVEVVSPKELELTLRTQAQVIGVNARDLDTLQMDAERAQQVLAAIPSDLVACHFSGIAGAADVRRVAAGRADAALVGEALMRQDDPTAMLSEMLGGTTLTRPARRS